MATSVGSSAAFTSSNMKPAAGEQIDAVWGQNIADNSGFLRAQHIPFTARYGTEGSIYSGNNFLGCVGVLSYVIPVHRTPGHNRLIGTIRGDGTFANFGNPDCAGTHGVYLFGDLGTFGGTTSFATANIGANYTWGSTYAFELNLDSYLSIGSWGTIMAYFTGTSADGVNSTNPDIQFGFSQMPKLYTTWAA